MKKPEFHLPPILRKLTRGGPAVVLPKDAGVMISYAGVTNQSVVVEAGSGSGFLTVQLGMIALEVISYEKEERFAKLSEENVKKAGLKNVQIKNKDILDGIDEREVDAVVLDMQEAVKAVKNAYDALKKDCFLVGYFPNIEQAKEFYLECSTLFSETFMIETIVRDFEVRDFGVRPKHFGLTHTAYIVFARK